jgi:hypothetical protein
MLQVYGLALNGAVPECTGRPSATHPCPFGAQPSGLKNKRLAVVRCARENSAEHVQSIQCVRWPWCRRQVENHMLLIVDVVVVLIAVVVIRRMRVPGGVNASTRGWMSDQWLAEQRASHSR